MRMSPPYRKLSDGNYGFGVGWGEKEWVPQSGEDGWRPTMGVKDVN